MLQVDSNDYTLDEIIDQLKADVERQKPVDFIQFCQCKSIVHICIIQDKNEIFRIFVFYKR